MQFSVYLEMLDEMTLANIIKPLTQRASQYTYSLCKPCEFKLTVIKKQGQNMNTECKNEKKHKMKTATIKWKEKQ